MCERKLHDLEHQQMVLENNLKKFLDLKREFSFLQHEAEESDKVVNDFIKVSQVLLVHTKFLTSVNIWNTFRKCTNISAVSHFRLLFRASLQYQERRNIQNFQIVIRKQSRMWAHSKVENYPCVLLCMLLLTLQCSDEVVSIGAELPLPNTQYQWGSASTGSYLSSTTSRWKRNLFLNSEVLLWIDYRMVDELQLNLVFDVNSNLLPTKLHLEIKDKNGRVVFRWLYTVTNSLL